MRREFAIVRKVKVIDCEGNEKNVEYFSVIGGAKATKEILEKWLKPEYDPVLEEAMMPIANLNERNEEVARGRENGPVTVTTTVDELGGEENISASELDRVAAEDCGEEDCGSCNTPSCHAPKSKTEEAEEEPMPNPSREFAEQKLDAIVNMAEFFNTLAKIAKEIKETAKEDDFEAALRVKGSFYDIDQALGEHPEVPVLTKLDLKKVNRWFNEIAADLLQVPMKPEEEEK